MSKKTLMIVSIVKLDACPANVWNNEASALMVPREMAHFVLLQNASFSLHTGSVMKIREAATITTKLEKHKRAHRRGEWFLFLRVPSSPPTLYSDMRYWNHMTKVAIAENHEKK
jgi:hypothetical protein